MAIEAITIEQSRDFNAWLFEHNLCKKSSRKRMRIYRRIPGMKRYASRDFVYVVSADEYRDNLENVHNKLIELSLKVMDESQVVKNREYIERMNQVEEDLLLNHDIVMNWTNGKSVSFKKIVHKITEPSVCEAYEEYVKSKDKYDQFNPYLENFRCSAQLEELGISMPCEWKYVNVIVKSGKVICVYCNQDSIKLEHKTFKTGFFDKFGYNLGICTDESLKSVIEKSKEIDKQIAI